MSKIDIEVVRDNNVCDSCVRDEYLSNLIRGLGQESHCNYCQSIAVVINIATISKLVEEMITENFYRTTEDYSYPEEAWYPSGDPVLDIIQTYVEVEEDIAKDILEIIQDDTFDHEAAKMGEDSPFDEEVHFKEKKIDVSELSSKWEEVQMSIKTESRFFNNEAETFLSEVFQQVQSLSEVKGKSISIKAGPKTNITSLYRARVFQSEHELKRAMEKPDLHLGPPPAKFATAGRMNPQGIAVFYGATNEMLAVREVRPPVSSRVLVGEFLVKRELNLLNVSELNKLSPHGSLFDPEFIKQLEYAQFVKHFQYVISRPILPNEENQEYLITQAIAAFLSERHSPRFDGILYSSSQTSGLDQQCDDAYNVVLFHHATKVKEIEIQAGTEISSDTFSYDSDGKYPYYCVTEKGPDPVGKKSEEKHSKHLLLPLTDYLHSEKKDDRQKVTLELKLDSLKVNHVEAIEYKTEEFIVQRYIYPQMDSDQQPF